jgi:hypothetical protein
MAILDVWIAQPGSACRVDDHAWLVTIFDAHTNVFEWPGGVKYVDLAAPQGHWAGKVPPGVYVVQAVSKETGRSTDHAIVMVDCSDTACVHLYVPKTGQHPTGKCKITITDIHGEGAKDRPASIQVSGTAAHCGNVEVTLACRAQQQHQTVVVPVSGTGDWQAVFREFERLGCACGGPVTVVAQCKENPDCQARWEGKLPCRPASDPK